MGFFINDDPFLLNIDTMREFKMGEIIYKGLEIIMFKN